MSVNTCITILCWNYPKFGQIRTFPNRLLLLLLLLFICLTFLIRFLMVAQNFRGFWYTRFLALSLSQAEISHFSKETWFLLVENIFRYPNLGINCSHCYWESDYLSAFFTDNAKKYVCTHTHMHRHTHKSLIFFKPVL